MIEAVNVRANAAEERLAVSIAEGEALRARIGVIEKERDTFVAALETARAELTAVLRALAAAREVGSAALASLKKEPALVPAALRNAGCLTRFIRLFAAE